jgi:hypothetical protein
LCDLLNPHSSPLIQVCQYLSFLLSGRAPRVKLLWGRAYDSFDAWAIEEKEQLFIFRRTVECAACLVKQRHVQDIMKLPFALAGVVDDRRSEADRAMLAASCIDSAPEQRDEWFMPAFLTMVPTAEKLLSAEIQRWIWQWGWSVSLTIAQLEFMHGRNRARAHECMAWPLFVAASYNAARFNRFAWARRSLLPPGRGQRRKRQRAQATSASASSTQPPLKQLRKRCAYDMFKDQYIQAKRDTRDKILLTSKTFVELMSDEWASVQADVRRLQQYRAEAELANARVEDTPPSRDGGHSAMPRRTKAARACQSLPLAAPVQLSGCTSSTNGGEIVKHRPQPSDEWPIYVKHLDAFLRRARGGASSPNSGSKYSSVQADFAKRQLHYDSVAPRKGAPTRVGARPRVEP